ncbi:hypothetical protein B0W47_10225 [Komagataeibacter nataicola]|uniref:Uncharacterized protein n=1 Tax=Komagataeibacter nataicola TaxID=265960 RepID=A0A9N7H148_9PROT|nr:hypothetical protein [Komagataeibacter nataicola]AQU87792.1 hypothetical protein B0W47_10225 [Komagataeibacter nataicola]PYD66187.1 hypothetical protein CDI09_09275 [Komagataeibacter nataicola]WEQ55536.1 hypothetical protein LV564_15915 [Komagataeibacter nataicola]WNM09609.1 hypothetical protein RI056_06690 [Komagataeibacter nataicola]
MKQVIDKKEKFLNVGFFRKAMSFEAFCKKLHKKLFDFSILFGISPNFVFGRVMRKSRNGYGEKMVLSDEGHVMLPISQGLAPPA